MSRYPEYQVGDKVWNRIGSSYFVGVIVGIVKPRKRYIVSTYASYVGDSIHARNLRPRGDA